MSKEYVFPIGVDDNGKKFQWVEDPDTEDCSRCCFWDNGCSYHILNKYKKGKCMGVGYFKRIYGKD